MSRQILLDTETTGLDPKAGHRIIEIGCVEMRNRRLTGNNLHLYLQPDREIDPGAMEVHGITNEDLEGKPRFVEIAEQFLNYIKDAELIIHNAPFDVGFIEHEFELCSKALKLNQVCQVTDSLAMARKLYPGQRASLDALCKRLGVNNAHRTLHGALLDSEILADVYLLMTGGQTDLGLISESHQQSGKERPLTVDVDKLRIVQANNEELKRHEMWLDRLDKEAADGSVWRRQRSVSSEH